MVSPGISTHPHFLSLSGHSRAPKSPLLPRFPNSRVLSLQWRQEQAAPFRSCCRKTQVWLSLKTCSTLVWEAGCTCGAHTCVCSFINSTVSTKITSFVNNLSWGSWTCHFCRGTKVDESPKSCTHLACCVFIQAELRLELKLCRRDQWL